MRGLTCAAGRADEMDELVEGEGYLTPEAVVPHLTESSSSSSSIDGDASSAEEDRALERLVDKEESDEIEIADGGARLYRHVVSKCYRLGKPGAVHLLACGRVCSPAKYEPLLAWPRFMTPQCGVCFLTAKGLGEEP